MRIGPFGVWEILIILVVVLLIFGPRRLPEMAKGLGQSVREFRKGIKDMKDVEVEWLVVVQLYRSLEPSLSCSAYCSLTRRSPSSP